MRELVLRANEKTTEEREAFLPRARRQLPREAQCVKRTICQVV